MEVCIGNRFVTIELQDINPERLFKHLAQGGLINPSVLSQVIQTNLDGFIAT